MADRHDQKKNTMTNFPYLPTIAAIMIGLMTFSVATENIVCECDDKE